MIVYKVPQDERLVIYNGIAVKEETVAQIEALGTPSVLVVPNQYHRCCAAVWKAKYPDLCVVCPPAAQTAVNQLVKVDATTDEWAETKEWSDWIQTRSIDGWGNMETLLEVELSKADSPVRKKALVVCDTLFAIPYKPDAGRMERMMNSFFDCSVDIPKDKSIIIPKVARISRMFAVKDWNKAEQWFRAYASEHGSAIGAIVVGHGVPIVEVDPEQGCTKALEGVADQLTKARW